MKMSRAIPAAIAAALCLHSRLFVRVRQHGPVERRDGPDFLRGV